MRFLVIIVICFSVLVQPVFGGTNEWRLVHGSVLQVFPEENKIMLQLDGAPLIFALEEECTILRYGRHAALESLRPITPTDFQDALCWLNPFGSISCILANYRVTEEGGILVKHDIFGNVK